MSKMKTSTIGNVCQRFSSGDSIKASEIKDVGTYPVFGGNGLRGYTEMYNFEGQCAIIGRQGAKCGNVRYFDGKAFMTEHAIVAVANKYNISGYIALKFSLMNLERYQGQSAQPGLSVNTLSDVNIELPEIDVQKKVFSVFNSIDSKIELNNKIISELESMAKTLYGYWFLQFDFPDKNGKPYKSSGGKMVWNEELKREIPEGWEVTNIGNLMTVVTGKEDANFSLPNGKYKFFTCSQETLLCDTPAFSGQAVLIAGNGDFNVKHYSGEFNAYQRTYVLIPENQVYYGAVYISSKNQIQAFKNGSNGSIVKFITKGDVENIPFILPNDDSIFHQINKLIEKIELCERENEELTKLRDFLLPMLMNGQVTFKE